MYDTWALPSVDLHHSQPQVTQKAFLHPLKYILHCIVDTRKKKCIGKMQKRMYWSLFSSGTSHQLIRKKNYLCRISMALLNPFNDARHTIYMSTRKTTAILNHICSMIDQYECTKYHKLWIQIRTEQQFSHPKYFTNEKMPCHLFQHHTQALHKHYQQTIIPPLKTTKIWYSSLGFVP